MTNGFYLRLFVSLYFFSCVHWCSCNDTQALSTLQRSSLVEKLRQKPNERMKILSDVGVFTQCKMMMFLVSKFLVF